MATPVSSKGHNSTSSQPLRYIGSYKLLKIIQSTNLQQDRHCDPKSSTSLSDTSLTSLREKFDRPLPFLLSHPSNKHHVELCDAGNIGHTSGLLCVCCTLSEVFDYPRTDRLPPSEMGRTLSIAARSPTGESSLKSVKPLVRTRPFNAMLRALSDTLLGMGFSMSPYVCLVLGTII